MLRQPVHRLFEPVDGGYGDHVIVPDAKYLVDYEGVARKAEVYLPPGYDSSHARYPTIYVHFGKEALEQGGMKQAWPPREPRRS